ncbi:KAP family P-loop NTPase fold protein [Aliivibrio fischeri]|uniref:KAP family P-loop NTPase fold protein n=1 Tax=Aliivibrio fischeri TaxID=668 RepID=UPI0007C5930B|nr:P-loop NTPase fold protein [Aliivibrio fischeri]MCE7578127.1 KAP family NTPase [Aliivibrio fischeri]MCE7590514.1 KAP family NTPase [Aliivibrio fischeri]MUI53013.1 NTPase KAP [Aliivibrio fischeri]
MSDRLTINWDLSAKISGEHFPEDKLDRAKYAEFLTKFLSTQGFDEKRNETDKKKNYVLNLNSEWGSGKTYFLKRWAEDLKDYYPVVYIDAWEKDYSEDPLMTVISAIIKDLSEQADRGENKFKAPAKLIGLLKAAAPGIARGISKRYLGIDPVEIMEANENENEESGLDPIKGEDGIDLSFAASDIVNNLIKEHEAKSEAIKNLKTNVGKWVEAVKALKKREYPAFIFIDELDRCRPSYAVEMLETIKHIFDIPGVVFVVATDTEQLQHAVKAVYGEGFNARVYLGRFFNSRFSLKAPNLENFINAHSDSYKLSSSYLSDLQINLLPFSKSEQSTLRNISVVLNAFGVSPRTSIQIADRIIATISHMPKRSSIDILMLTTLHCLKEQDNELFEEIISGKFNRTLQTGGKPTVSYLESHWEEILSTQDGVIYMDLEPRTITNRFELNQLNYVENQYPDGQYTFNFIDYLKEIFSSHFNSTSFNYSIFWSNNSAESNRNSHLQECTKNLADNYHDLRHDQRRGNSSSIAWLKYIYIEQHFDKIRKDEYQDFVELASAFDSMGVNELTSK